MPKLNVKSLSTWLLLTFVCFAVDAKIPFDNSEFTHHYIGHHIEKNALRIETDKGEITFKVLNSNAINVVFHAQKNPLPGAQLPSFANKEGLIARPIQVRDSANTLTINAGDLKAIITKQPFGVRYQHKQQDLIREESGFFQGQVIENETTYATEGVRFTLTDDEQLLGGGERTVGMNRRGYRLPLYNKADYGYTHQSTQMNFSLPAVMSSKKYLILFDNSAKGYLDIGASQGNILSFEAVAGRIAYTIFSADQFADLIRNYVSVTGKQPMPPRWALGNFASRFGYHSQQEVLHTVDLYKQLAIPLDAVVMDLYWFGQNITGHMGNLDWDRQHFPQPQEMLHQLNQQGVNPILITEPYVLSSSKRWQQAVQQNVLAKDAQGKPKTFDFYFGNTGIIDIFNANGRNWFNEIYATLNAQGIKGWWGDLGEPEVHPADTLHQLDDGTVISADAIHNVYGHQWANMLYHNLRQLNPNERPFILMRSGFAGSQRYGMIPWTGDVSRSWEGLQPQVELSLQMGLFGLGYTHSDLGGFAGGEYFDKELYIRWLQYGVFQPIFRPHGQENIASEPVYHDKQTQDIARDYITLRYQLLPYNYTMAFKNSLTGMPLMRPIFFADDNKVNDITNAHSYFWGDAFFVHPIVNPKQALIDIALPKGIWFDFFTEQRYPGNQSITSQVDLTTFPVFVRAGSFIPMIEPIQTTANYSSAALTLHYYADPSVLHGQGMMYEDDGKTFAAYEKKQYEQLLFNAEQNPQGLKISLRKQGYTYPGMPAMRTVSLIIHNIPKMPKTVTYQGQNINFNWTLDNNTLTVKVKWHDDPAHINIGF